MKQSPEQIVDELIVKAKKAQLLFEKLPQEKIDEIVTGVAWAYANLLIMKKFQTKQ
jgi:hypothetical protein